jgi:type IV pilus assembly protein PilW
MKRLNKQLGISLVEVLVALVISLFLLAGIVQVYTGNKTAFRFTNALAEIQENGRFALDTMTQDLRLAGEWGCVEFDSANTDNFNNTIPGVMPGYDSDFHDFVGEEAIEGTDGVTDTIIVRGGRPGQGNGESPFETAGSNDLIITNSGNFDTNDIVLVARCGANDLLIDAEADILRVSATDVGPVPSKSKLTLDGNKSQQFEKDAMVIELQTVTYSIGVDANSGEPTLFRQEFNQAPQELVEGIEDMQIWYGLDGADGDGFPNQYLPANNALDYESVVSVRVQLLVRSIDDFVTEDPQTYTYNGATITPADRRIRQVFSTTIALRNRIGSI